MNTAFTFIAFLGIQVFAVLLVHRLLGTLPRARRSERNHRLIADNSRKLIFSLRREVGEALDLLAVQAARKNLELICRIGQDVPDQFRGDPARLLQMIANLVGYALIFMDCQMPLRDGYPATRRIRRRHSKVRRIPIIAMSANAPYGGREKCLQAGMDDYVPKPVNPGLLADTLRRWLDAAPAVV